MGLLIKLLFIMILILSVGYWLYHSGIWNCWNTGIMHKERLWYCLYKGEKKSVGGNKNGI